MKDSARIRKQSTRSARALNHMRDSGAHTRGGLGTESKLDEAGKFEREYYGVPTLSVNGRTIWDNSRRLIHITGLPGSFKSTALGFVFAGTFKGSLLCVDIDLEYCRATWRLRKEVMGNKVYFIAPRGRYGFPSAHWNFFTPLIQAIKNEDIEKALDIAKDISFILVRENPDGKRSDNDWVEIAARDLLVMALLFLAKERPAECTPSGLYVFLMQPVNVIIKTIGKNASLAPVMRRLIRVQAEFAAHAHKQVEWKIQRALEPLSLFEPESCYARVTSKSDFDPAELKNGNQPVTIYLCIEGDELESAGTFISLFLSMAIERIAMAAGEEETLIMADEFAQTPKTRGLIKAIRNYRKRRLKIVTVTQTRHSISDRWGESVRKSLEALAGTVIWISPELEVSKELETKSGTKTVMSHGAKDGDSGHVGKSLNESKAPNLHVSELYFLPEKEAVMEIRGVQGLVVADLIPWWEIHPLSEQIDEGYRDDFYVYDGVAKDTD